MMENVVPHLMPHSGFDLGQSAAFKQIVIQRNPHRAAEAADVSADPIRLAGSVKFIHVGGGNPVGARHTQDWILDFRIFELFILIEERRNINRRDETHEGGEHNHHHCAPHPPIPAQSSHQPEQRYDQDRTQHDSHSQTHELVAHPSAEVLIQQPILMLAKVSFVDRERKTEH